MVSVLASRASLARSLCNRKLYGGFFSVFSAKCSTIYFQTEVKLIFRQTNPIPDGMDFQVGKTYYIICTEFCQIIMCFNIILFSDFYW